MKIKRTKIWIVLLVLAIFFTVFTLSSDVGSKESQKVTQSGGQEVLPGYSAEFIDYIKKLSNSEVFGLRDDGRFYPYSSPDGRKIGYGQPVFDNRFYAHGWPVEAAEKKLIEDLRATIEKLRRVVQDRTGRDFDRLNPASREILLDFGYTEGADLLSDRLIQAAVSLDWETLLSPEVYVRYQADWPDSSRNKAYFDRWRAKGGF
jgi:hypothetical protein